MTADSKPAVRISPCNATALRKASRRLTQLYDAALEPTGLRSTQFAILVELANWSTDSPTLAELADALATDRSSLGHNLRPLEREGFIVLREGAADRRQHYIALTAKGKGKCREGLRLWRGGRARGGPVWWASGAGGAPGTPGGVGPPGR